MIFLPTYYARSFLRFSMSQTVYLSIKISQNQMSS